MSIFLVINYLHCFQVAINLGGTDLCAVEKIRVFRIQRPRNPQFSANEQHTHT